MNRIGILDSLRAFAALSVCLYHFICTTTGYISSSIMRSIFEPGRFGVQLFFVISGFVIPWSMHAGGYRIRNFTKFFLKRLARLEPPYVFSVLLILVVLYMRTAILGKSNDHIEISGGQVAAHFLYLIPFFENYQWLNQVYWTLSIEFQYYLFMAFAYIGFTYGGTVSRLLLYFVCLSGPLLTSASFLPYWLPVFLLGILLFLYNVERITTMEFILTITVALAVCVKEYSFGAVVFMALPVVAVMGFSSKRIPVLNSLGEFSYSIYLIHPVLGASLINILSHHFTGPMEKCLVVTAGILVTLAGSWLMNILVERPSRRLSGSIYYRNGQ